MTKFLRNWKSLTLAVAALGATPAAHAFGLMNYGPKIGLGFAKPSVDGSTTTGWNSGLLAGLGFDFGAGPIGVTLDVLYAHRVYDFTTTGIDFNFSENQVYLPLQLRISLIPMFYISGGMYYSYGFGNVSGSVGGVSSDSSYSASNLKRSDVGIVGGLGARVPLGLFAFTVEARYNYGLMNLSTSTGSTIKSNAFDLLAGFMF